MTALGATSGPFLWPEACPCGGSINWEPGCLLSTCRGLDGGLQTQLKPGKKWSESQVQLSRENYCGQGDAVAVSRCPLHGLHSHHPSQRRENRGRRADLPGGRVLCLQGRGRRPSVL